MEMMARSDSSSAAMMLFVAGLFSMTRINLGGSIALSELMAIAVLPYTLLVYYRRMKQDGMAWAIVLLLLWLCGAVCSDWYNGNSIVFALKGIATPITMLACFVYLYVYVRKDISNVRWYFVGVALSYVLSTFILSRASSIGYELTAEESFNETVGYKLYWIVLFGHFFTLPIIGWYLKTSPAYSVAAILGLAVGGLFVGGRSLFLTYCISLIIILVGGNEPQRMIKIRKHFVALCIGILIAGVVARYGYKYVAVSGMLGEAEQKKYELQTKEGESVMRLLMSGRAEFFIGLFASVKQPFIGRGSWAVDKEGICRDFLYNYGSHEDYEALLKSSYMQTGLCFIPFHTHIITYWMWHGIFGLMFWVYFLYVVVTTLRSRMHTVPGLYGYFAVVIPAFLWDLFFSPLGARMNEAMLLLLCLLVRMIDRDLSMREELYYV